MAIHMEDACPRTPLACSFGCVKPVLRQDLTAHAEQNLQVHLASMTERAATYQREAAAATLRVTELEAELHEQTERSASLWSAICSPSPSVLLPTLPVHGDAAAPLEPGWDRVNLFLKLYQLAHAFHIYHASPAFSVGPVDDSRAMRLVVERGADTSLGDNFGLYLQVPSCPRLLFLCTATFLILVDSPGFKTHNCFFSCSILPISGRSQ